MADYQLTADDAQVLRTTDGATIPNNDANRDWQEYQAWLAAGNVPDPYVAPEPSPPSPQGVVLYDHENRIRAQEGVPPIDIGEFLKANGLR